MTLDQINARIQAVEREIEALELAKAARKKRKGKKRQPDAQLQGDAQFDGSVRERTADTDQPEESVRRQSGPQAGGTLRKAEQRVAKLMKSGMTEYEARLAALRADRGLAVAVASGEFVEAVPLRQEPAATSLSKAEDKLNARAEQLRKADSTLTPYEALVMASREHPEWVDALR